MGLLPDVWLDWSLAITGLLLLASNDANITVNKYVQWFF